MKPRFRQTLLWALALGMHLALGAPAAAAATVVEQAPPNSAAVEAGYIEPRTILAFYDSRKDKDPRDSRVNRYAAMPLNHLGLKVRLWDLANGLPGDAELDDVRGVLAWLYDGAPVDDKAYLRWMNQAVDAGYRVLLMGNLLGAHSETADSETYRLTRSLTAKLGVQLGDRYVPLPYRARFPVYDRASVGMEWDVAVSPRGFHESTLAPGVGAISHLSVDTGAPMNEKAALVVTSVHGGFVHSGYDIRLASRDQRTRWIINPFKVFADAFATMDLPKPDVTTAVGRRIYYSHIDGDGWRSLATAEGMEGGPTLTANIILHKVIRAFPGLPVTVAPVVADLDPSWLGTAPALEAARRIFAEPQVEGAHHTYSHPFAWGFFEPYDEALEKSLSGSGGFGGRAEHKHRPEAALAAAADDDPLHGYDSARAYVHKPFDTQREIVGAKTFLEALMPPGKHIALVQWSGDTRPFANAVRTADAAGLGNINGGDTRYDAEYPSVAAVAAIGVEFSGVRQIYTSASNENTYTELWTRRYYGFRYLRQTVENTDTPRRLTPFNIYYHMYSGAKAPALKALIENLDFAKSSEIAPIKVSDYVRIANGFYDTGLERLGPDRWRIQSRGALNTIRFAGLSRAVDYGSSTGVLGHRFVNQSLYVALDPSVQEPVIALQAALGATSPRPVLEHARWLTEGFEQQGEGFTFNAHGFGDGGYLWRAVSPGEYVVEASRDGQLIWRGAADADAAGALAFTVPVDAIYGVEITVRRRSLAQLTGAK